MCLVMEIVRLDWTCILIFSDVTMNGDPCTVVSSSSVTGTLDTALKELYLVMRSSDLHQMT